MKITGRTMMVSHYSMDATIKKFKDLGFDGLEMCFPQRDFQFRSDMVEPFFAEHTVGTCKKYDMPIYSTSYHCDYIFNDAKFEDLKKAVVATPLYGTDILIISNAGKRIDHDLEADWAILVERTKELIKLAEPLGVTLAMEFEPGMICGTTKELLRLMDEVGSEYLKANLDIGHVFLCDPDPLEAIAMLKGKFVHGHIENMRRGVHRHLPPHMGDMDLTAFMKAVVDTGFDGVFALDLYQDDYEFVSPDAISFIKKIYNELNV